MKIKISFDQLFLLLILLSFMSLSWAFEQGVAGLSFYTVLVLKIITVVFDVLIATYYRKVRRSMIRRKVWYTYFKEMYPFLLVFGLAYISKLTFVWILSYPFPFLSFTISSAFIALLGTIISSLVFPLFYRPSLTWLYKMIRSKKFL